ncbi:MAG: hypothetical protein ACO2PM_11655 [Pyrobaculum sp.]|jgi:hypothetical protein|nr:hypothetical protein [Pyrobaculum sp.]
MILTFVSLLIHVFRFVEEVLPAYDALDAALSATNEALGPTGFQLDLWGDPHT